MCVIIHLEPKKTIDKDILKNCYEHNTHGWGIMWNDNNKLWYYKEHSSFASFMKVWKDIPRHAMRGVHFRIKTHGLTNTDNCHPFVVGKTGTAMMHNGVIRDTVLIDKDMNDTHNFVKYEVTPIAEEWEGDFIADDTFRKLMEEAAGVGSKLLFIDAHGRALRCRETAWYKKDGIYFSNQHSTTPMYSSSSTNHSKNSHSQGGNNIASFRGNTASNVTSVSNTGSDEPKDKSAYPFDWRTDDYWKKTHQLAEKLELSQESSSKEQKSDLSVSSDLNEQNIKSDLYAGNKTEEEGRAYIDNCELEQLADMEQERKEIEAALRLQEEAEDTEVVTPFPSSLATEDEEEDDEEGTLLYWNIEELSKMGYDELLETVENYPKSTVFTLKGLLDACLVAGVEELNATQLGINALNEEEAVG